MKVLFYVEDRGTLGHARRVMVLAKGIQSLRPDAEIVIVNTGTFTEPYKGLRVVTIKGDGNTVDTGGAIAQPYDQELYRIISREKPWVVVFDTFFSRILQHSKGLNKVLVLRKYRQEDMDLFFRNNEHWQFNLVIVPHAKEEFKQYGPFSPKFVFVAPLVNLEDKGTGIAGKYGIKAKDYVVTATCGGGGFDDAQRFVRLIVDSYPRLQSIPRIKLILITGPHFRGSVDGKAGFTMVRYEEDMIALLKRSDIVICQAGYNICNEILALNKKAVLVPQEIPNDDQAGRARWLSQTAGCKVVHGYNVKDLVKCVKGVRQSKASNARAQQREMDYAFLEQLFEDKKKRIKVGKACNNNCIYCSALDIKADRDLGFGEVCKELERIRKSYNHLILPCNSDIRKDFLDILRKANELGFRITLETNGRMFYYRNYAIKAALYISQFEVFISGPEQISEKMARANSYIQTLLGMKNLLEASEKVSARTVISQENMEHLSFVVNLCRQQRIGEVMLIYPLNKFNNPGIPEVSEANEYIESAILFGKDIGVRVMPAPLYHNPWMPDGLITRHTEQVQCLGFCEGNANGLKTAELPGISIIIPSYNRKGLLKYCLQSLLHQDYPKDRFEIIVVDDGSDDGTKEMVLKLKHSCNFKYIYWPRKEKYLFGNPGNRAGPARNLGAQNAKFNKIVFLDSDMIAPPGLLLRYAENMRPGYSILGIRRNLEERCSAESVLEAIAKGNEVPEDSIVEDERVGRLIKEIDYDIMSSSHPWFYWISNNVVVDRNTFDSIGGFDTNFVFWGDEDQELGFRLLKKGISFIVDTKAICYHQYHIPEYVDSNTFMRMKRIHKEIFYKKHLDKEIFLRYEGFFKHPATRTSITLNLSSACNMNCPMCFDSVSQKKQDIALPTDILMKVLNELRAIGIRRINLSGGEPSLRHDFFEILDYAKKNEFQVHMSSNGSFDGEFAAKLAKSGLDSLGISLDFLDPEKHNGFRRCKGLYERVIGNIELLHSLGYRNMHIKTVVMAPNLGELHALALFAERINLRIMYQAFNPFCGSLKDGKIIRSIKSHIDVDSLWVPPSKYSLLDQAVDNLISAKESGIAILNTVEYLGLLKRYFRMPSNRKMNINCMAEGYFGINYDGRVMPCWGVDWNLGNVKEMPLSSVLSSYAYSFAGAAMGSCDIPCLLMCYEGVRKGDV